jgi:hypothetical protein
MISLVRRTIATSALVALGAAFAGTACGGEQSLAKPALVLSFTSCVYSGMLTMTPSSQPARIFTTGLCGGAAYDGGGNGTAIDLALSLGGSPSGNEGVNLTFETSSANQTIDASDVPSEIASDNFLGAQVPAKTVWARHRYLGYGPAQGSVAFGAIDVQTIGCTADACDKGTASFDLTFQHVAWTTTSGQVDLSGHIVVTTVAGSDSCKSSGDCHDEGFACNQVSYVNQGNEYTTRGCGPTNATGVDLGGACTTSSDCASGYCDLYAGECAVFCSTDADCDSATRCVRSHWDDGVVQCMRRCATDADCAVLPQAKTCVGHYNAEGSKIVGACGGAVGTRQFGQTPTSAWQGGCATELQLSSNDDCTRFCATSADCAKPLPVCSVSGLKPANGGSVAYASVCHP